MQFSLKSPIRKALGLYLQEQMEKTIFETSISRGIDIDSIDWAGEPQEISNQSTEKQKTVRDLQRTYKSLRLIRNRFEI